MDSKVSRDIIEDGDTVILRKLYEPDEFRMLKVTKEDSYNVFGQKVSLLHLIGLQYGSVVEIDRTNKLPRTVSLTDNHFNQLFQIHHVNIPSDHSSRDEAMDTGDAVERPSTNDTQDEVSTSAPPSRDNRHLNDDQTAQKLSADQIEVLKSSSADANEIVNQLVANSDTFSSKTAFAQAKYIKKKKEKYVLLLQLVKPTIRLITQYFYQTSSFKSLSLRIDSVSQILSSLNAKASGKYLIIDSSIGLLTAALVDRVLGKLQPHQNGSQQGKVIQSYTDAGPNASWREAVEPLNYDPSLLKTCLLSLPFSQLVRIMKSRKNKLSETSTTEASSSGDDPESVPEAEPRPKDEELLSRPAKGFKRNAEDREYDPAEQEKWLEKKRKKLERKNTRKAEETEAVEILTHGDVDGFLLVYRGQSIVPIARVLLHFTRPSMPFVIYSPTINPLEEAAVFLKESCINVSIHESWMRKYQVLPERTRPEASMSGSSGYILTGTKLLIS